MGRGTPVVTYFFAAGQKKCDHASYNIFKTVRNFYCDLLNNKKYFSS